MSLKRYADSVKMSLKTVFFRLKQQKDSKHPVIVKNTTFAKVDFTVSRGRQNTVNSEI